MDAEWAQHREEFRNARDGSGRSSKCLPVEPPAAEAFHRIVVFPATWMAGCYVLVPLGVNLRHLFWPLYVRVHCGQGTFIQLVGGKLRGAFLVVDNLQWRHIFRAVLLWEKLKWNSGQFKVLLCAPRCVRALGAESASHRPQQLGSVAHTFKQPIINICITCLNLPLICFVKMKSKGEWSVAERTTFMEYLCNERS